SNVRIRPDSRGCGSGFLFSGDLSGPVGLPGVAVDEAAEVRHAIHAANSPPGTRLFQTTADHVLAGPLDLAAADGSPFGQSRRIVQRRDMGPQLVPETL